MASTTLPELGKWRKRLLPVYADEMKQFIAMSIMLFCILFSYTIVRTLKDTLLINAPHVDTKMVVSMAKLFVVTPASILFVILYAKMSNIFSKERLFYFTLAPFVIFFFVYAFIIYPTHSSYLRTWFRSLTSSFASFSICAASSWRSAGESRRASCSSRSIRAPARRVQGPWRVAAGRQF